MSMKYTVGSLALLVFTFLCGTLATVPTRSLEPIPKCPDSDFTSWTEWDVCTGPRVCPQPPDCRLEMNNCIVTPPTRQAKLRTRRLNVDNRGCDESFVSQMSCEDLPACECDLVAWSDWTACFPRVCNSSGSQTRILQTRRDCPLDRPQLYQRSCFVNSCCEWSIWQPYGDCSVTCGNGTRSRVRLLSNPSDRGCSGALEAQSEIELEGCSQDLCDPCEWLPFSEWGGCSTTCGEGVRTRIRRRVDGIACRMAAVEVEETPCQEAECGTGIDDSPLGEIVDQQHFVGCESFVPPNAGGGGGFDDDLSQCFDAPARLLGEGGRSWRRGRGMSYIAKAVDLPAPCCQRRPSGYYHRNLLREYPITECASRQTCGELNCPALRRCEYEEVCEELRMQRTSCGNKYKRRGGGGGGGIGDGDLLPDRRLKERGALPGEGDETLRRLERSEERHLHTSPHHRTIPTGLYPSTSCHSPHSSHSHHSPHSPHSSRSHKGKPHRSAYRPIENTSKYLLPRCCDLLIKPVGDPNECSGRYTLQTQSDFITRCDIYPVCRSGPY